MGLYNQSGHRRMCLELSIYVLLVRPDIGKNPEIYLQECDAKPMKSGWTEILERILQSVWGSGLLLLSIYVESLVKNDGFPI